MKKKTINIFVSLGVMVLCGFVAFEYIDHVSTLGLGAPLVRTLKVFLVMSVMLCGVSFVYNCMEKHNVLAVIQFINWRLFVPCVLGLPCACIKLLL